MTYYQILKSILESNFLKSVHYYVVVYAYRTVAAKVGTELLRVLIISHLALIGLIGPAIYYKAGLTLAVTAYAISYLMITFEMYSYIKIAKLLDILQHIVVGASIICLIIGV